jgi:protein-arginine kinase activator protein McsA
MNVQKLREALSGAIQDEDYEKAAALRDQLKRTEDE